MHLQVTGQITINAPAQKVWRVLAHEFDRIGEWASVIPHSHAVADTPAPDEAAVCGRVCGTAVAGFSAVRETFTAYDEAGMRFAYEATEGRPAFVTRARNQWSVRALAADTTLVEARGELELHAIPGIFMLPLLHLQLRRTTDQLFEELKYYVENDQLHPRKLAAQRNAVRKASVRP